MFGHASELIASEKQKFHNKKNLVGRQTRRSKYSQKIIVLCEW